MKQVLILLVLIFISTGAIANPYTVNVDVLNVRSGPVQTDRAIGVLTRGSAVDVKGINGGWAIINYNGQQAYVKACYLEENSSGIQSETKRGFCSRIFTNEGEAQWFTVTKWIVIILIGLALFRLALAIIVKMLAGAIVFGLFGLGLGVLVHWLGWFESTSIWTIGSWGFYSGAVIGFIFSIVNFGDTVNEANSYEFSSLSHGSNVDANGLKHFTLLDGGREYHLTQDSKYSDCNYTDQDGNQWYHGANGFRRV